MTSPHQTDLYLFTGEASGDVHGAELLAPLQQSFPQLRANGVGGPQLQALGLCGDLTIEDFQVMGFTDVFLQLPKLLRHFYHVKAQILDLNPKAVILIDYPDFNLRMAKALKKAGYQGKIIQYICPSVWAWRKHRIKHMVAYLDALLTIFPFEKALFAHSSLQVEYVGNPSALAVSRHRYAPEWLEACGLAHSQQLIGIFPGSRPREILHNLPKQLEAAEQLYRDDPSLQFALSVSSDKLLPALQEAVARSALTPQENLFFVPSAYRFELMKSARAALATSGTVTLELGLFGTPTVVGYHVSPFNAFIAKRLFRLQLPHYCLTNIALNQRIFPELFHDAFTTENLYRHVRELYQDTSTRRDCIKKCQKLQELLLVTDASEKIRDLLAPSLP